LILNGSPLAVQGIDQRLISFRLAVAVPNPDNQSGACSARNPGDDPEQRRIQ